MKKRALGVFLSIMMAASVLAGCSGGQKEKAGGETSKAEEAEKAPEAFG